MRSKLVVAYAIFLILCGSAFSALLLTGTISGLIAIVQALLYFATAEALLRNRKSAKAGLWAITVFSAVGVIARGLPPIEILSFGIQLSFTIWYSNGKQFAMNVLADKSPVDSANSKVDVEEESQTKELVTTREHFASIVCDRLYEREPPFNRDEWHVATVTIPEKWDSAFELAAWANQFATVLMVIANGVLGPDEAGLIFQHISVQLIKMHVDADFPMLIWRMLQTEPLPADHPVFKLPECARWSTEHGLAFARASVAIESIDMPADEKLDALSRLGRCFVYATHCAAYRFGDLVEKLRFVDSAEEMVAAYQGKG
jgi:hypothetical protein